MPARALPIIPRSWLQSRLLRGEEHLLRAINPRIFLALSFGAIVAATASGFAAADTVPTSKGGDGAGVVSGYLVSNVKYTLNTNPEISTA